MQELAHKLPNDFRLRILGNWEILEKSQIWMETKPSAQSPFQKLNFVHSSQKYAKIEAFLLCPVLLNFSIFVGNKAKGVISKQNTLNFPKNEHFFSHVYV